jgi:hypothetical protein
MCICFWDLVAKSDGEWLDEGFGSSWVVGFRVYGWPFTMTGEPLLPAGSTLVFEFTG